MRSGLARLGIALSAGIVLALGSAGSAHAQPVGVGSGATGATVSHCVVKAPANVKAPAVTTRCFSSFQAALDAATGGAVKLAPGQRVLTQAELSPASDTVIGIEYKDANFGGSDLIMTTGGSFTCSGGLYVDFTSLGGGWDNSIGSARTYANCKSGHFEYTNDGGSVHICGCATMGTMNDKTSSIRFSVSGL